MKIPYWLENFNNGSRQNKWIEDYLVPIMVNLDPETAVQNYRTNRRETLRQKMSETGVFDSLERLENEGTSGDGIVDGIKEGIEGAEDERRKQYIISLCRRLATEYPNKIVPLNDDALSRFFMEENGKNCKRNISSNGCGSSVEL